MVLFLSTPSARRATQPSAADVHRVHISIHALREEGDDQQAEIDSYLEDFYPRPPRGGRRVPAVHSISGLDFYPRPPRGGRQCTISSFAHLGRFLSTPSARRATLRKPGRTGHSQISIHALREEGDSIAFWVLSHPHDFYPRPPRGGRRLLLGRC